MQLQTDVGAGVIRNFRLIVSKVAHSGIWCHALAGSSAGMPTCDLSMQLRLLRNTAVRF